MFIGYVDEINRNFVEGWAINADELDATVEVLIFIDGYLRATVTCNEPREDLQRLGKYGDGNHGFHHQFPFALLDRREHRVHVVFKNDGSTVPRGHKLLTAPSAHRELVPIMVTAPGRSGTTVLMNRLNQLSEICVADLPPYELRMVSYYAAAYRVLTSRSDPVRSTRPDDLEGDRFHIGFNPFFGEDFEPAFSTKEKFLHSFSGIIPDTLLGAFRTVVQAFYQSLAEDQGKQGVKYFAEKTNNVEQNARDFTRHAFGDIKELVLVRDPRDVYCSHQSYFRNDVNRSFAEISEACETLMGIRDSGATDVLFVGYEQMIRDPHTAFAAVGDFLGFDIGVPADPASEAQIFSEHATSRSPEASIGRWQTDLSNEQKERCNLAWRGFLEVFGYAEGHSSRPKESAHHSDAFVVSVEQPGTTGP